MQVAATKLSSDRSARCTQSRFMCRKRGIVKNKQYTDAIAATEPSTLRNVLFSNRPIHRRQLHAAQLPKYNDKTTADPAANFRATCSSASQSAPAATKYTTSRNANRRHANEVTAYTVRIERTLMCEQLSSRITSGFTGPRQKSCKQKKPRGPRLRVHRIVIPRLAVLFVATISSPTRCLCSLCPPLTRQTERATVAQTS